MKRISVFIVVFVLIGSLLFSSSSSNPVAAQAQDLQLDTIYSFSLLSFSAPLSSGFANLDAKVGTLAQDALFNSEFWGLSYEPEVGNSSLLLSAFAEAEAYYQQVVSTPCPDDFQGSDAESRDLLLHSGINCLIDTEDPITSIAIDNTTDSFSPVIIRFSGDLTLTKDIPFRVLDDSRDTPELIWVVDGVLTLLDDVLVHGTFISVSDIFISDNVEVIGRLVSLGGSVYLDGRVSILQSQQIQPLDEFGLDSLPEDFQLPSDDYEITIDEIDVPIKVVEEPIEPEDGYLIPAPDATLEAIPGEYILFYKNEYAVEDEVYQDAAAVNSNHLNGSDAQILTVYQYVLNAAHVILSDEALLQYRNNPKIELIEPNFIITGTQSQSDDNGDYSIEAIQYNPTWGLDRIDQRNLPLNSIYRYDKTASGIHVYVLDSGIRPTHTEFTSRIGNGIDMIKDGNGINDCDGHGTHVSGTIGGTTYGVAKAVTIHPVRVLNCEGTGMFSQIIGGMDWILAKRIKPAVVNMSLGIWGGGISLGWEAAIRRVVAAGIPVVVAAGNDRIDSCTTTPSRVKEAIVVGSFESSDEESYFSNYGSCLDLYAPGEQITSAAHYSNTATTNMSGTSMAAPHVAGAAAIYLKANPNATPSTVENFLISNSTKNVLHIYGPESPNRALYSRLMLPVPVKPNSSIAVKKPEYIWRGVPAATQYQIQLTKSGSLVYTKTVSSSVCDSSNTCRITFFNVLDYGKYQWRIRAQVSGSWSLFSSWTSFTISRFIPIPMTPKGTVASKQPEFRWTKTPETTKYTVQLVKNGSEVFSKVVSGNYCGSIQCAIRFADLIPLGNYSWRVRSYARGTWQPYSTYLAFSVSNPIPKLIKPIGSIETRQPEFAWTAVPGATKYNLQLIHYGKQVYLKEVGNSICNSSTCRIVFRNVLDLATYEWRVRAYVNGAWQLYSPQSTFSTGFDYYWRLSSFTKGWYPVNGEWSHSGWSYRGIPTKPNSETSAYYRSNYKDFDYVVVIQSDLSCEYCTNTVYFRGSPLPHDEGYWNNGYAFSFNPKEGFYQMWKHVNGNYIGLTERVYDPGKFNSDGEDYIEIYADNSWIRVMLNDYFVVDLEDNTFTTGKVGFGVYGTSGGSVDILYSCLIPGHFLYGAASGSPEVILPEHK
jgi:subtilisin family serine protease